MGIMKHSGNRIQGIISEPMYIQAKIIPLKYNFILYEIIVIYWNLLHLQIDEIGRRQF